MAIEDKAAPAHSIAAGRETSAATQRHAHPTRTVATEFDSRSNSLDILRLVFASTVAFTHALAVGYGWQPMIGDTHVAILAVDEFFIDSGFLIVASWLRLGSLRRFAWHRALRILPAFWVCLAVTTLVVAPLVAWLEGRSPAAVFTADTPAWRYLTDNAGLWIVHWDVAGLPTGTGVPGVINGALWTLFYEVFCYAAIAALGVAGLLRSRAWVTLAIPAASWAALIALEAGLPVRGEYFWRFTMLFFLGAAAYLYRDRIRIDARLAAAAVLLVAVAALVLHDYRPLGGVAFAYAVVWVIVATPRLRRHLRTDLSHGIYIFHWPLVVMLALAGLPEAGMPVYLAVAGAVIAAAAWASWRIVEKPALARRNAGLGRPPGTT